MGRLRYRPTNEKTPARTLGFLGNQMVARGGIEPPTQGFSIQYSPPFDYRFQAVKSPNQNVAHNLCLKINVLGYGVKTVSTNCRSVCEIAQAKMCNEKLGGAAELDRRCLYLPHISHRSQPLVDGALYRSSKGGNGHKL